MSSILQELEKEIANVTASVQKSNVGVVREVGDGVAKVEGLSDVMLNEMISFPGGVTGLAMNLEEGEVGEVLTSCRRTVQPTEVFPRRPRTLRRAYRRTGTVSRGSVLPPAPCSV